MKSMRNWFKKQNDEMIEIQVDDTERRIIVRALADLRDKQRMAHKNYDFLDSLIVKVCDANVNKAYFDKLPQKQSVIASDIENIALKPIKECGVYSKDIQTCITNNAKIRKDIDKAKYMSERVIELYNDMEVPQLSKKEYTKTLKECTKCMKESYELKYKAIDQIDKLIKKDDIDDVSEIKKYIKQSDEKIDKYQKQISELERKIRNK